MKHPTEYSGILKICAVSYGILVTALALQLFTDEAQTASLLYWVLAPTSIVVMKFAPGTQLLVVGVINNLLFLTFVYGGLALVELLRKKQTPNHPSEPASPSQAGSL